MKTSATIEVTCLVAKKRLNTRPIQAENLDFQHKAWINDHDKKESGFWHL